MYCRSQSTRLFFIICLGLLNLNCSSQETIVIFDLDGTITRSDTYIQFLLMGLWANPRRLIYLPQLTWFYLLFKLKIIQDFVIKEKFLHIIFANTEKNTLNLIANQLAGRVVSRGLRKNAKSRIAMHQNAGHRIIMATASLDVYAQPISRLLGIAEVVATKCKFNSAGVLTGYLDGPNLKSTEKQNAVEKMIGNKLDKLVTIAYSDNDSDIPLWSAVRYGVAVNPNTKLLKKANQLNLKIENWDI